jgi:hypothetical protein
MPLVDTEDPTGGRFVQWHKKNEDEVFAELMAHRKPLKIQ